MSVADVRMLIPDLAQYDRASYTADGLTVDFRVMHPVQSGTAKVYVNGVMQTSGVDYTLDEALGLVTFVTAPSEGSTVVITYQYTMLSDDQITAFLTLEGNDTKLAAAQALDTIASNEALVQKVIKIMDLKTDGAAVARELRQRAQALRNQVANAGAFDWAEVPVDAFSYREKLLRDAGVEESE